MSTDGQRYELPEELRMARTMAREYIQNEIVPLEQELEHDSIHLPQDEFDRLAPMTKEMGLWCIGVPEEHGGAGLSIFAQAVLDEEMVQHAAGLYLPGYGTLGSPPPDIIWTGTDYQVETYGQPTVRGDLKGWFAITEPSGGSDPARGDRDPRRTGWRRLVDQREQDLYQRRAVGRLGDRLRSHRAPEPTWYHGFYR